VAVLLAKRPERSVNSADVANDVGVFGGTAELCAGAPRPLRRLRRHLRWGAGEERVASAGVNLGRVWFWAG